MDINKIKDVLIIAQIGSVSKACKYLYASQPTLSREIKELEEELKISLFDRTHNRLEITEEGRRILPFLSKIVQDYEELQNSIANKGNYQSIIRIGHLPTAVGFIVQFASQFYKVHPEISLHFYNLTFNEMDRSMNARELDGGVALDYNAEYLNNYVFYPIIKSHIMMAVSKDSPLAKKDYITPEDISRERLVALDRSEAGLILDTRRYISGDFTPRFSAFYDNAEKMFINVGAGREIAFTSSIFDSRAFNIVKKEIKVDPPYKAYNFSFFTLKGQNDPSVSKLIDFIDNKNFNYEPPEDY